MSSFSDHKSFLCCIRMEQILYIVGSPRYFCHSQKINDGVNINFVTPRWAPAGFNGGSISSSSTGYALECRPVRFRKVFELAYCE